MHRCFRKISIKNSRNVNKKQNFTRYWRDTNTEESIWRHICTFWIISQINHHTTQTKQCYRKYEEFSDLLWNFQHENIIQRYSMCRGRAILFLPATRFFHCVERLQISIRNFMVRGMRVIRIISSKFLSLNRAGHGAVYKAWLVFL